MRGMMMQSYETRRSVRLASTMTDLGSPLPLAMPMVAKTVRKGMAKATRRVKARGRPRVRVNPNGTGPVSGTAKVRVTTNKRRSAAHVPIHEPGQHLHPRLSARTRRGRVAKRGKVVLAPSPRAQRRASRVNAHHVMPIEIACHSGRAVFVTRLTRVKSNTSDLMALPALLLLPRRLSMLINQRVRRPRPGRRRRTLLNETSL